MAVYLLRTRKDGRVCLAATGFLCKCCIATSLIRRTRNLDQPRWQYLWTNLARLAP